MLVVPEDGELLGLDPLIRLAPPEGETKPGVEQSEHRCVDPDE